MKSSRIAVVGATGPTGRTLTSELVGRGCAVRTVSRRTDGLEAQFPSPQIEKKSGDAMEFASLAAALKALGNLCSKRYFDATASTAFGFVLAMARRVRAAPLGCLRPCSHPCSVRTETPRSAANWDWDKPVFLRASITGDETT